MEALDLLICKRRPNLGRGLIFLCSGGDDVFVLWLIFLLSAWIIFSQFLDHVYDLVIQCLAELHDIQYDLLGNWWLCCALMSAALILIQKFTEDREQIEQADDDGWKIIVVVFIDVMVWFNWFREDWIELETSIRIGIFGNGQEFLSVSKNSATYDLLLCDLADSFLRRIL